MAFYSVSRAGNDVGLGITRTHWRRPFWAMIPGAMVALSLGLLLELPVVATSVLVVFGVFGIGLGGEMTY